jgi:hypothetical protein
LTFKPNRAHTARVHDKLTPEEQMVSVAAAILGRRGGQVKSDAKAKAVRENGKKGGRPPKVKAK